MSGLTGPSAYIPEIFQLHAKWMGEKPALIHGAEQLSWQCFGAGLRRVAAQLQMLGAKPGDCVAIAMDNRLETPFALFGAVTAGLSCAPLNLTVSDDALMRMINDCGARILIASPDQVARLDALRGQLPTLEHCLAPGLSPEIANSTWQAFTPLSGDADYTPPELDANQIFNIIYSSGTTGTPKGIVHTHKTRLDWSYALALALRYHAGAITLCNLGLYSNISWVMMLCTWMNGGTLVLQSGFDAGATLEAIKTHSITHTAMVPVQYQRLVDHPDFSETAIASLQAIMSCGSTLPAGLKDRLFDVLPGGVIELYGLTEGVITTLAPEDAGGHLASVGKPLLGTDLLILNDGDEECPAGEAGEILAHGNIVMPGYLNRPDATAEASWRDAAGRSWLRTGDIGKLDEDGFLYIVDRKKDMIISGGQNIYPADLEAVLLSHPEIKEAAVIGLPDPIWGETPIAIIADPGDQLGPAEALLDWANARLGKRQKLRDLHLIEALPRNPNGKILKRELRAQFAAAQTGANA